MAANSIHNIDDPITDLNKTQLVPEKIITGIKNVMIEELAKAEKQIQVEVQNHLITTNRLIDVERKLSEQEKKNMDQEKKIMDQQKETDDYKKNILAQQEEIDKQKTSILAQQEEIDKQKTSILAQQQEIDKQNKSILAQQKEIDEQKKSILAQKKEVQDLQTKLDKLEKKNCSINIFKTITTAVAVATLATIIHKYIK
ncbi:unnamed protein product [Rotaria sordida]|uniref:Uncharacterized protein n=1 Tax=Rotaria sordida TaxID=392033 RepID=A0A813RB84_9BILA|nr:unnamed protein product [Rotaria sordida]CAF1540631.1 unnamed protein product [Rotaria sordida]CAF3668905.1 unnamed protein product [Rotaria sordida]CAF3937453.1 unnamed protein product [Rotaria sordida]